MVRIASPIDVAAARRLKNRQQRPLLFRRGGRFDSRLQEKRVADAKAVTPGAQLNELVTVMTNERILAQARELRSFGERYDPL
jgi:hypothetical protein